MASIVLACSHKGKHVSCLQGNLLIDVQDMQTDNSVHMQSDTDKYGFGK